MLDGLRLAELMAAMSLAIDLGIGQSMEWVLRSCLLGVRLSQALGFSEQEQQDVYYLSLVRHIGCTANSPSDAAMFGDELGLAELLTADPEDNLQMLKLLAQHIGQEMPLHRRARLLAGVLSGGQKGLETNHQGQCEVAVRLSELLGFDDPITNALWQIYERWDGGGTPHHLQGEAILPSVRVVHLAQDMATFLKQEGVEAARKVARNRAGRIYDPAMVDCFDHIAAEVITELGGNTIWEAVLAAEPGMPKIVQADQRERAFQAFADFTDMKSPHTLGHSRSVANLVGAAAQFAGLSKSDTEAARMAGYIHDMGRVAITSSIWCKGGKLNESEWERVRLHPYYTERIFAYSPNLKPLGSLAALHHERLDGSGYYRGLSGTMMNASARLLAAANTYCALTESRPHHPACSADEAEKALYTQVKSGLLDANAVDAVISASRDEERPSRRTLTMSMSDRELEVLRLLARGSTNKEIAQQYSISEKTVERHVTHIYNKIGVSTRAAASLYAMQNNLL